MFWTFQRHIRLALRPDIDSGIGFPVLPFLDFSSLLLELFKVCPVKFGALPAAAEQLFTKPRSRPKIEPNFEARSWFFLKDKPQNSYEPEGLANSLVSGTPKILKTPFVWTWTWLKHFRFFSSLQGESPKNPKDFPPCCAPKR